MGASNPSTVLVFVFIVFIWNNVLIGYRLGSIHCNDRYLLVGVWTKKFVYGMLAHQSGFYLTIFVTTLPISPFLLLITFEAITEFVVAFSLMNLMGYFLRSPYCISRFPCQWGNNCCCIRSQGNNVV
jgi:hypothetical protein